MPKLYIGNLAYSTTNEDLEALFSRVGKVESAAVVTDKFSGRSKGFGFVEMADSNDAASAIESLNDSEFQGRRIKVAEARQPQRPWDRGGGHVQLVMSEIARGQSGALGNAETMLLVHDHDRKARELHVLLDQCMGANEQLQLPRGELAQHVAAPLGWRRAAQQSR